MPDRPDRCATCRFWGRRRDHVGVTDGVLTIFYGYCRRRAPVLTGTSEHARTEFPAATSIDWCGEFQAAPTEPGGA